MLRMPAFMVRLKKYLRAVILAVLACTLVALTGSVAMSNLPTISTTISGEIVELPDWSKITLDSLGTIENAGIIDTSFDGLMGYEFSRSWSDGAKVSEVLKFGDLAESWDLGDLSLKSIGNFTGADINQLPLNQIGFLEGLNKQDLFGQISQSELSSISFNNFEDLWNGVTVSDVPAIGELKLKKFPDINDRSISSIPFIDEVPLDKLDKDIGNTPAAIVRLDQLYGSPEGHTFDTISGAGDCPGVGSIPEDCSGGNCPHTETFLPGNILPGRWVSGKAQEVEGGCGPLKVVGGGKEPTGRVPFSDKIKLVFWDIKDPEDRVETRIFFRVCKTIPFSGRTCTPFNIPPGGIPFVTFNRDNYVPT